LKNSKIKIGVLGCASIAERSLIPSIQKLDSEFYLSAVASRSIEKAKFFAEKFSCNFFSNYEDLINSNEIKAVYIPLPNSLHYEWVKKSLNAGLHVLCEKSLATNLKEAEELNGLAAEKSLILLENFQFRFHSQLKAIKKLVSDGVLGDLRCIRSSFGFPAFSSKNNIRYQRHLGGGALLDAGAYPLKIVQMFMGDDLEISAASLHVDKDFGVDIWGGAYVKQKKGDLFAEIAFGFDNYYQCSLELWGNKAKLFTNRIFTSGPNENPILEIDTEIKKEKIILEIDDHFINMLHHFYLLISEKKDAEYEYIQNINQARLIDELRKLAHVN
jgi:predicted dehydrogenase